MPLPTGAGRNDDRVKSAPSRPATLGGSAAAGVRIVVWCRSYHHQVEPDAVEMARHYGADVSVLDWKERLVCSKCGGRAVDVVLTGSRR